MPNKSDSAGKLHQYFTVKYIKLKSPQSVSVSPLDSQLALDMHLNMFNQSEINSIDKIGELSAGCIINIVNDRIVSIEDIGVSSGVIGIENTDDLLVTTQSGGKYGFSLKCSTNISQILSKNMGARSLLKAYFNAEEEQIDFNTKMNVRHLDFLNATLYSQHDIISTVKKEINDNAKSRGLSKARFEDQAYIHMNEQRNSFLEEMRNNLFETISAMSKSNQAVACNLILDTDKHHIIGEYRAEKEKVEYIKIESKTAEDIIDVKKRGNDSLVIETNDYNIGFRYKFESGITSSIKLVGDYKKK